MPTEPAKEPPLRAGRVAGLRLTKRTRIFIGILLAYALGVALPDVPPARRHRPALPRVGRGVAGRDGAADGGAGRARVARRRAARRRARAGVPRRSTRAASRPTSTASRRRASSCATVPVAPSTARGKGACSTRCGRRAGRRRPLAAGTTSTSRCAAEYGARTTPDIDGDPRTSVMYVAAPVHDRRAGGGEIIGAVSVGKPVQSFGQFVEAARRKTLERRRDLGGRGAAAGRHPLGLAGAAVRPDRRLRALRARRAHASACRASAGARSARSAPPTTRCATRSPAATTSPTTCRR